VIGLNEVAARLAMVGDKVIFVAYTSFDSDEDRGFQPSAVIVTKESENLIASWSP
jgi:aspartate 1-decarboxylase